jgi:hypothetical protein
MTQLTRTAYIARMGIKLGLISLVGLIVGRVVLVNGFALYKKFFPDPPPPATMGFGVLPPIQFPQSDITPPSVKLETPDGGFPQTPYALKVFDVQTNRPNLLALERSNEQAVQMGFRNQPIALTESLYRWSRGEGLPTTLEINIYEGTYTLIAQWAADPYFLDNNELLSENQAITKVEDYLNRNRLLPTDLDILNPAITYLKASGGEFTPTLSLSEADFIDVDYARIAIDTLYPAVTADPKQGLIEVVVSGNRNYADGIVRVNTQYFPIDYVNAHTYPIKSAALAWQELTEGKAFIASLKSKSSLVAVRRVELGYFDSYEAQDYLQPIWIFSGDNEFVAYVSAIATDFGTK